MTDFYVSPSGSDSNSGSIGSPWATLSHARDVVRTVNTGMSADINVWLRGGTFFLSSTLAFTEADSGTGGFKIRWIAYPGETPIISGGVQITGWSASGSNFVANAHSLNFAEMWVNDTPACLARFPSGTDAGVNATLVAVQWGGGLSTPPRPHTVIVNNTDIPSMAAPGSGAQMQLYSSWSEQILRINAISNNGDGTSTVTFKSPESVVFDNLPSFFFGGNVPHYFWRNAPELLDTGGEFFLNTGANQVTYRPRAGENMSTVPVYAPNLETLWTLQGSSLSSFAHDIQFVGLTFEHTTFSDPINNGFIGTGYGFYNGGIAPRGWLFTTVAFYANNVQNCLWRDCTFKNLGNSGLGLDQGCAHNIIDHNLFTQIAWVGIYMYFATATNPGAGIIPNNNNIRNNTFTRCGLTYPTGTGFSYLFGNNNLTEHNKVVNVNGYGMMSGFGNPSPTPLVNNTYRYNDISQSSVMEESAQLYVETGGTGTLILENYFHDSSTTNFSLVFDGSGHGVYQDGTPTFNTVKNNSWVNVGDNSSWVFEQQPGHDCTYTNFPGGQFGGHFEYVGSGPNTFNTDSSFFESIVQAHAGPVKSFTAIQGQILTVGPSDLIPSAGSLSLTLSNVGSPVGGTVSLSGGNAVFSPTSGYVGPANFDYTLTNGTWSGTGTVPITVVVPSGTGNPLTTRATDTPPTSNLLDEVGNILTDDLPGLTPTTTTLVGSPNPSLLGASVNFTATVTPSGPTGTVDFFDSGSPIATGVALSAGSAATNISSLAIGTHGITATYNGDGSFSGSSSTTFSQQVNPIAPPATKFPIFPAYRLRLHA